MALTYRWSDLIVLVLKQVKHIPTITVDALECDQVSATIAAKLPWKFTQQTIADGQIPLINNVQDYDPPFNIFRLNAAWLTRTDTTVQQDHDLIIKDSNAVDMFRRAPYAITSVALQGAAGRLRLSSAVIIPQGQTWELRGEYQINVRVTDISQRLWFDDRYVNVAIAGLTYQYYLLADDPRAGGASGVWPGGQTTYTGQLAQFMGAIQQMANAEDMGGDMQVFPDEPLGITSHHFGHLVAAYGVGGGGIDTRGLVAINNDTTQMQYLVGGPGVSVTSQGNGYLLISLTDGGGGVTPPPPPPLVISLASISLNPGWVLGGNSSTGVLTLTGAAPDGGAIVTLSSNTSFAQVPATVTIPAGATSATFTVNTSAVGVDVSGAITAAYGGASQIATFIIGVPGDVSLVSITLNPTSVAAGGSVAGTATMSGHTLGSGALVSLTSSNVNVAQVPTAAVVIAGATTGDFTVTTSAGAAASTVTISGNYGNTQSASLNVTAALVPALVSITANPTSLTGSGSTTITVTINMPAPAGGLIVGLGYANYDVGLYVPSSLTIPAGQTSGSFTLTFDPIDMTADLWVEAMYGGHGIGTTITLTLVQAPIYAGYGAPGATSATVSGTVVTLHPILQTIGQVKNIAEVVGDSFGPFYPNGQNIYLLLAGGARNFVDQNNNTFAMNPPIAVTLSGRQMYLYQSTQGLYMSWTVKIAS